jgi:hypothetical protein
VRPRRDPQDRDLDPAEREAQRKERVAALVERLRRGKAREAVE